MKGLFQTSETNRHHHLVWMDLPGRECLTTVWEGHRHRVRLSSEEIILEDEAGHRHELKPLVRRPPGLERERREEVVREVRALYGAALAHEQEFRRKGREAMRYYSGQMWTESELLALEEKRRAPSVINEIEPKIDLLSGYQRQNRFDIKFFPTEDGDVRVADILTTLWKNVADQNLYDHRESWIFQDGCITGRGLFQVMIDRDEDISGRVVVEKFPWDGVCFGPHESPDLSDLEYLVKKRWYSRAKVLQLWPEKAKEVEKAFRAAEQPEEDENPEEHTQHRFDQYGRGEGVSETLVGSDAEFVNVAQKEFLVLECWRKVYFRVPVVFNASADFFLNGHGINLEDLKAVVRDIPGFDLAWRKTFRMRVTTVAHTVLLEDDFAPPGHEDFPIVPVYAKKHGTNVWGKVEAMKYPNKEANKLHSKALDILDKAGGYGWFSFEGTFANSEEERKFDRERNTAGFHVKVTGPERMPVKVDGVKTPVEVISMMRMTSDKMKEISNIIPELLGLNSRVESGRAIEAKQQQGLIGNEFLFDHLRLAKLMLGKRFLQMLPHVYTPEKILRVIANVHRRNPVRLGGVPFSEIGLEDLEAIRRILEEEDFSRYDVSVGEATASPTARAANFNLALDLIRAFPQVGGFVLDLVINLSDFPEKDEWISRIQSAIRAAGQTQEEQSPVGPGM